MRSCGHLLSSSKYAETFSPSYIRSEYYTLLAGHCSHKLHTSSAKENSSQSSSSLPSPVRVKKLITAQSDPLLAYEIFNVAYKNPNFRHSYSCYHALIIKLAESRHFSLTRRLLPLLKSENYPIQPGLFADLILLYGNAHLPNEALKLFHEIIHFNCNPSPKLLNRLIAVLVAHRGYLHPAFEVFKSAHKYGVSPNTKSYNILMRAFCLKGDISIAYSLFNKMFKKDVVPDVDSYRILMQGLCRKSQVNGAVDLLEDMLNKGYVPGALTYTTLLNNLCRKKKLREAYKLLCRMKVKGCNPDIVHYNTVILGFCREGRALDARKVLEDMPDAGCSPNLVSYRTLVCGLCHQGMFDEAKNYMVVMISKGFSPHFAVVHALVKGFLNVGKIDDACDVLDKVLRHGDALHGDTWAAIVPRIYEDEAMVKMRAAMNDVLKIEIMPHTRIVDAGANLGEYLIKKIRSRSRKV